MKRCPNKSRRNKKTNNCDKIKTLRFKSLSKSLSKSKSKSKSKKKRKMKPTDRNKYVNLVDKYNQLLTDYKNGTEKKRVIFTVFYKRLPKGNTIKTPSLLSFKNCFSKNSLKRTNTYPPSTTRNSTINLLH